MVSERDDLAHVADGDSLRNGELALRVEKKRAVFYYHTFLQQPPQRNTLPAHGRILLRIGLLQFFLKILNDLCHF